MTAATVSTDSSTALDQARARLSKATLGHIINGRVESESRGGQIDVVDPSTGDSIAWIPSGSAADVDRAVSAARAAFKGWRSLTPGSRSNVMLAVADAVDAHTEELALLESLNTGKPLAVSRGEIPVVAESIRFMAGAGRALQAPATDEYVSGYVSMIRREPVGVVGAITPWNYPLMTASWKIAGALTVGNTMVLKPSELTPLTTLRFMDIVSDILPAGVLNVVLGTGIDVGAALSQHPGIDLVSLTGSVVSGQHVIKDSAKTLKLTHLELGGKAPVVVFDDADLAKVVAGVRYAGYWNSGQECGAATRVLCSRSVREELTERLSRDVSTLKVGAPTEGEDIEIGPLISDIHLGRVNEMVERAERDGATLATGGHRGDRNGFFFTPTVVADVERGSEISTHEIFGPVVTIEEFTDEADAIELANSVPFGLAASVWTDNVRRAFRVSSGLDSGTVWVNSHLVLPAEMPWGGFGASGHGREMSTLGLDDFSRTKHVMIAVSDDV